MMGIQANTAMLFYRKIREVIAYHLEQQAHEIFDGAVELDESYFGGLMFQMIGDYLAYFSVKQHGCIRLNSHHISR